MAVAIMAALTFVGTLPARAEALVPWRPEGVPELELPTLAGPAATLEAEAGKVVIVHFFATWCEPCRDELSSLERLADAFAARPFRILAIDVGEPIDRVRRFLERNKISIQYPVLIDFEKKAMRAWQVEMLPTSYVLNARFCPLWKAEGPLEWDVGLVRATLESEVARIERKEPSQDQENCKVKGDRQ